MPCFSWGVPAEKCKRGNLLHEVPGTACSVCYAREGRNRFPNVRAAQYRRLHAWHDLRWVDAMEEVIRAHTPIGNPFFRWFDTGDLQNQLHFDKIIQIARRLPEIWFWLPTQEKDIVRNIAVPKNLIVRVSAVMIDGPTSPDFAHTSRIAGADVRPAWASLVTSSTKALWYCPGELHETYNCGTCRACWDRDVKTVVYIER